MSKNPLHILNVSALIFLLVNLMAPNWVNQALADPPPSPPTTGPLSGNIFTDVWQAAHQSAFGQVPEGAATAFYHTTAMITGVGTYPGQNNIGQAMTLTVIRHYVQNDQKFSTDLTTTEISNREASGHQRGVFWGTISGPAGSINIIGASMAWTANNVTTSVFIPVLNHDAVADFYIPDNPSTPHDNFHFNMLAENWDPNAVVGPPQPCLHCLPPAQGVWCPDQDPLVIDAREELLECIVIATALFVLAVAGALATLVPLTQSCLAIPEPAALTACLGAMLTITLIVYVLAAAAYAIALASCLDDYLDDYNAAAAAACPVP